jgi:hypothetical protein
VFPLVALYKLGRHMQGFEMDEADGFAVCTLTVGWVLAAGSYLTHLAPIYPFNDAAAVFIGGLAVLTFVVAIWAYFGDDDQ